MSVFPPFHRRNLIKVKLPCNEGLYISEEAKARMRWEELDELLSKRWWSDYEVGVLIELKRDWTNEVKQG